MNLKLVSTGCCEEEFFGNSEIVDNRVPYFLVQNQTGAPLYLRIWNLENYFLQVSLDRNFSDGLLFDLKNRTSPVIRLTRENFEERGSLFRSLCIIFFYRLNCAYRLES